MFFEILVHTPKWVYGLFILLVILGIQQSRDREVRKFLILPLPIGMIFLSYFSVYSSFGSSLTPSGIWFIALVAVAFLVVIYLPVRDVKFNPATESFNIAGSWIPFMLMMAIFFTKYYVGVLNALQPLILSNFTFVLVGSLLYGAFSGVFIARAISTWRSIGLQSVLVRK